MQDFYPTILKFAIVAALALIFIGVTYLPQQEAQQVMGENMEQALTSVKEIIEDSNIVDASVVRSTVNTYCESGNTTTIEVVIGSTTHTFTTSTISDTGQNIDTLCADNTKKYKKETETDLIRFIQQ